MERQKGWGGGFNVILNALKILSQHTSKLPIERSSDRQSPSHPFVLTFERQLTQYSPKRRELVRRLDIPLFLFQIRGIQAELNQGEEESEKRIRKLEAALK